MGDTGLGDRLESAATAADLVGLLGSAALGCDDWRKTVVAINHGVLVGSDEDTYYEVTPDNLVVDTMCNDRMGTKTATHRFHCRCLSQWLATPQVAVIEPAPDDEDGEAEVRELDETHTCCPVCRSDLTSMIGLVYSSSVRGVRCPDRALIRMNEAERMKVITCDYLHGDAAAHHVEVYFR